LAHIGEGTCIAVITWLGVKGECAAAGTITGVVGAGVIVFTFDGCTHALACLAVVGHGAGISVEAFPAINQLVFTTGRPIACIDGAIISIVAGSLIIDTVTVIIDAVTDLCGRF